MIVTNSEGTDKVRCDRCGVSIWWWKAYHRTGEPEATYCSRACAIPDYGGALNDGGEG